MPAGKGAAARAAAAAAASAAASVLAAAGGADVEEACSGVRPAVRVRVSSMSRTGVRTAISSGRSASH
eukprot:scaffold39867_cov34-Phaeocystis_antarctica.AAC.2